MEKVKVKIALAITPDGKWNCCGFSDGDEDDMMTLAIEPLDTGEKRYWITAEVAVPETLTVEGSALDAERSSR